MPGGRAHLDLLPVPARPWDIEDAGSVCTLCPSQCNITFTVRDERVERVLARDHDQVDDGWLCDKGRWGYQSVHSEERILEPLVRDGGKLRPATWERALEATVAGLRKAGAGSAAIVGGQTSNEEGYLLQRIFREALGSPNVDSRAGGRLDSRAARLLTHPDLAAAVPDIDGAACVLVLETDPINEAPIIDLRLRKAVRRFGCRLVVAASGPTALDAGAAERLSFAPGTGEAFLRALQKALLEVDEVETDRGQGRDRASGGTVPGEPTEDASPGATPHEHPADQRETLEPEDDAGDEGRIEGQSHLAAFLAEHSLERLAQIAELEADDLREAAALLTAGGERRRDLGRAARPRRTRSGGSRCARGTSRSCSAWTPARAPA